MATTALQSTDEECIEFWDFPEKLHFLLTERWRIKGAYGGRGGAKSWGFARALLILGMYDLRAMVQNKEDGTREIISTCEPAPARLFLCTREVQKSIKESVYRLLKKQIETMRLGPFYTVEAQRIIGRNGTEFIFAGLSDQTAESIKSYEGVDICWVEEAHTVTSASWDILIPTIRKERSEIWFSMNPEMDTDPTYVRFVANQREDAKVVKINWRDNPWFPKILDQERREFLRQVASGARKKDEYENIWEGMTRPAVEGAIFHDEIAKLKADGRLCRVPYDDSLPVHTVWDMGWGDSMVIIMFQRRASEVRVIDYIEDTHRLTADYVTGHESGRDHLNSRSYAWGTDFLPHDGFAKDRRGRADDETLTANGRKVDRVPDMSVDQGIRKARALFPRLVIDKEKAGDFAAHLSRYRRRVNQRTGAEGTPEHDDHSHAGDAVRYLALVEGMARNEAGGESFDPYDGW